MVFALMASAGWETDSWGRSAQASEVVQKSPVAKDVVEVDVSQKNAYAGSEEIVAQEEAEDQEESGGSVVNKIGGLISPFLSLLVVYFLFIRD